MCSECLNVPNFVPCLSTPRLFIPSLNGGKPTHLTQCCLLNLLICDNEDNRPLTPDVGLPVLSTHCSACLLNLSAHLSTHLAFQTLLGTMNMKVLGLRGFKSDRGRKVHPRKALNEGYNDICIFLVRSLRRDEARSAYIKCYCRSIIDK